MRICCLEEEAKAGSVRLVPGWAGGGGGGGGGGKADGVKRCGKAVCITRSVYYNNVYKHNR